jgi:sugar lactone lactonase YvrE
MRMTKLYPVETNRLKSAGRVRSHLKLTALASLLLAAFVFGQSPADELKNLVTVAGIGPFIGDGFTATSAGLNLVEGVAVDATGNLWIADASNNRIRKVDAVTGIITTVAGTGTVGFAGDNGPATQARLNGPSDLALDAAGNLYFTDSLNHRVRKVATTGIITTVAGSVMGYSDGQASTAKFNQPRGIAVVEEASGTCIYTADLRNNRVRKIDGTGLVTTVAGVPATPALIMPFGVALDAQGNLYIGEAGRNQVTKVSPTKVVTTFAMGLSPRDIAVESASGNIYFVENGNNRVRVVKPDGTNTVVAGNGTAGFLGDGGPADQAELFGPFFIALDASGNVYIGDRGNSRVRKVDRVMNHITTVAGGFAPTPLDPGRAMDTYITNPAGLVFDALGNLYVAENFGNRVRKVDVGTGAITTVAGSPTGQPGDSGALLNSPYGIALDGSGTLYIADLGNHKVRKVSASGGIISTVAGTGDHTFTDDGCPATEKPLNTARAVAIDGTGNLWIADSGNNRIRFVNLSNAHVTEAGQDVPPGCIITVAGTGEGGMVSSGDDGPALAAKIPQPGGLAFDPAGNLYITSLHRVRFIDLNTYPNIITTVAGTDMPGDFGDTGPAKFARLTFPQGMSVDPAGNLFIADTVNNRIRRIDTSVPDRIITTVAGNGSAGFTRDGGSATVEAVLNPRFIALDASRNLYFGEFGGSHVRRLNVAAKELSVSRSTGNLRARVEVYDVRLVADLSDTTLTAIDSNGHPVPDTRFNPIDFFADPADPTNPRKRVFEFGPAELSTAQAFRLDSRFASDGKTFSGDAGGGPARVWIGLKNSDDQGTRFDLLVEVYRNGGLVTSGLTRCIAGVTRNQNNALEAVVPFDPLPFSSLYQSQDTLSFRVLTRIGTQPDNTMCLPGHASAAGLRIYYNGLQRPSRFVAIFPPGPLRDLYLHTEASSNFLNEVAPNAAAPLLFKDSPSVSFSGGNPWTEVGAWSMTIP